MKTFLLIFFAIPLSLFFAHAENSNSLELNLTVENGFLPECRGSSGIMWLNGSADDNKYLLVKGLPSQWINPKIGQIYFNLVQLISQGIPTGKFPETMLKEASENLFIEIDTAYLTEKPIKCAVNLACGEDENGDTWFVIDSDNDLNFENDSIFKFDKSFSFLNMTPDDLTKNIRDITIERYVNSKMSSERIPLLILFDEFLNETRYSIPLHMATSLNINSKKYNLTVEFKDIDNSDLFIKSNPLGVTNITCSKGEIFEIEGKTFKYKDVNSMKRTLNLEILEDKSNLKSTQTGYNAIPFKGKDFKTGQEYSLESYKGKYVLLDFWGTWCGVCLHEMPELQKAYATLDKNKFAILGIVRDNRDALAKYLKENNLAWPQILSDRENDIINDYNITSYPTTFLISPNGIMMGKDLKMAEIIKLITEP